jgi:hypothetical protein
MIEKAAGSSGTGTAPAGSAASASARRSGPAANRQRGSPAAARRGPAWFVGGAWALLLLVALTYSLRYGFNVPYFDEWGFVDQLAGEPVTPRWLWSQYGDHRLPLAKLIWLGWIKLTGSFRVGACVNILTLGVLALGMIATARRLRGGIRYSDAFLPLLMLHLGQGVNFLWSYQTSEMLPGFLECTLLLMVLRSRDGLTTASAWLAGILLVLLALAGPGGLPFVLGFGVWLGVGAWKSLRSGRPAARRAGLVAAGAGVTAIALCGPYFMAFDRPQHAVSPGLGEVERGGVQFLSTALGAGTAGFWPYAGAAVLGLLLGTTGLALAMFLRRPAERFRALGLAGVLAAGLALALAMGWGRGGGEYGGVGGLNHWYVTFSVPALAAAFLTWVVYGPTTLGPLVQMCLFTVTCLVLSLNVNLGLQQARERGKVVRAFEAALGDGTVPLAIAERFARAISDADVLGEHPEFMEDQLRRLHRARLGPFRGLRGPFLDPEREVCLPLEPAATNQLTWEDGVATCTGDDPFVVFSLPRPLLVYGVRITFAYEQAASPAACEFYWCLSRQNAFSATERNRRWEQDATSEDIVKTVLVMDVIDRVRFDPDGKPCRVRIKEVALLTPEAGRPLAAKP